MLGNGGAATVGDIHCENQSATVTTTTYALAIIDYSDGSGVNVRLPNLRILNLNLGNTNEFDAC
jgi:hypothetical protein